MDNFNNQRIYRKHNPIKILLRLIAVLLVLVLILSIAVFFGFRRYIVYTEDGLYLDIPWLRESAAPAPATETASDESTPTVLPSGSQDADSVLPSALPSAG